MGQVSSQPSFLCTRGSSVRDRSGVMLYGAPMGAVPSCHIPDWC